MLWGIVLIQLGAFSESVPKKCVKEKNIENKAGKIINFLLFT